MSEQLPPNSVPGFDEAENPKAEDLLYLVQGGLPNRDRKVRLDKLLTGKDDNSGEDAVIANLDLPNGSPTDQDSVIFATGYLPNRTAKEATLREIASHGNASIVINKRYTSGTPQHANPAGVYVHNPVYTGNLTIVARGWKIGGTVTTSTTYLFTKLPGCGVVHIINEDIAENGDQHLKINVNGTSVEVREGEVTLLYCYGGSVIEVIPLAIQAKAKGGALLPQRMTSLEGVKSVDAGQAKLEVQWHLEQNTHNALKLIGGGVEPSKDHGLLLPHGGDPRSELIGNSVGISRIYADANGTPCVWNGNPDDNSVPLLRATPVHSHIWRGKQTTHNYIEDNWSYMGMLGAYTDTLYFVEAEFTKYTIPYDCRGYIGAYKAFLGSAIPSGQTVETKIVIRKEPEDPGKEYIIPAVSNGRVIQGVFSIAGYGYIKQGDAMQIAVYMKCSYAPGFDPDSVFHTMEATFRENPI